MKATAPSQPVEGALLRWLQALTVDLIRTRLYQHDALTNPDWPFAQNP